jgi:GTPase KRas protein
VPLLIAVNKADLDANAAFSRADIEQAASAFGCEYIMTSAKMGLNIEEAFQRLARKVAEEQLETGERPF